MSCQVGKLTTAGHTNLMFFVFFSIRPSLFVLVCLTCVARWKWLSREMGGQMYPICDEEASVKVA